jgi:hypothetical protein
LKFALAFAAACHCVCAQKCVKNVKETYKRHKKAERTEREGEKPLEEGLFIKYSRGEEGKKKCRMNKYNTTHKRAKESVFLLRGSWRGLLA